MYQYFFEGDTVRLAYWRIDYGENKTMYANTAECKQEIVAMLTQQGYTPKVSTVDQTGNEWIDGMCFTDHSAVDAALAAGCKNFICDGDMEDVVDTLTAMNDSSFRVDAENVWHITVPNVPPFSCYNIMACVTANSVNNQMISINNGAAIPLMKSATDPVLAYDIKASSAAPLAMQINIVDGKAYLSSGASESWQIGEIKSFGYKRPQSDSELLCNGHAFDREMYTELFDLLGATYGFPAEFVIKADINMTTVACINGSACYTEGGAIYRSTDCMTWSKVYDGSNVYCYNVRSAGNKFFSLDFRSSSSCKILCSSDGVSWSTIQSVGFNTYGSGQADLRVGYSAVTGEWLLAILNTDDKNTVFYKYTSDGTCTKVGTLATETLPFITYLNGDKRWLIISTGKVYVIKDITVSSIESMAESTYTYSTTSTFTSKVPAAVGNMAFAATSDSIYVYTKDSYTTVALPDAIHSNVTQVVYLYDLDTVVAINNKGIVSLNTNTLEFNISSLNSGNSPSIIHECAYDTINKRIICACGDVYTVDTSNTALPLIDTNGFTYIKAK